MSQPTRISDLDLDPATGRAAYFNCDREWREEFIYFLMVDRFHDDLARNPVQTPARSAGSGSLPRLKSFCGGTLRGVRNHLDYIAGLGCTSIWLSPVFENTDTPDKYHGYSIQSYLTIDPRFGTKQDLIDLVDAAHLRNMRVFLDVVANHAGDIWQYPGGQSYRYSGDARFPLESFRRPDRPLPLELRDERFYHRRGEIQDWNDLHQAQRGDFFSLKDFHNDEDPEGLDLIDILVKAHCYWIKEADIDGFRMDAVKHMREIAVARFCTGVREYAYSLGKRWFFLFGELIAGDEAINRYTGPNTSARGGQNVFFGLNSVLDFPLSFVLPGVLKGLVPPQQLIQRYEGLRFHALNRGELGRYLVTFLDNHDQVGQEPKRRFAEGAADDQVIAGIGYLLCALGTSCIYYGTEQGFSGKGSDDAWIREAMFDLDDPQKSLLNTKCRIYEEIAKIAAVVRANPPLRFGRMYFREISGNGVDFGLPQGHPCTLAFSRILANEEVLVAYNTSTTSSRKDGIVVDAVLQRLRPSMEIRYSSHGRTGSPPIQTSPGGARHVLLDLEPMEFAVLA